MQVTPAGIRELWKTLSTMPFGKWMFSQAIRMAIPYTGSMGARVEELEHGRSRVTLCDRRAVRNHLDSLHALALANLGEFSTGVALMASLPDGSRAILTEINAKYLKKARGTITATAHVEVPGPGKHDLALTAHLTNAAGEEVCQVTAHWRLDIPEASASRAGA